MSVSFTSGTNWSNANLPTIDADHPAAAKELDVVIEDLAGGASRSGALPRIDLAAGRRAGMLPGHRGEIREQSLVAVVAARVVEETATGAVLDVDSVVDLTGQVRRRGAGLDAPEDGTWRLFTYWMHGTGQTASPSASVNYTVNYLDPRWGRGRDRLLGHRRAHPRAARADRREPAGPDVHGLPGAVDLRGGGLFWGRTVAEEFRARRGYDIAPWLPFLTRTVQMMAVEHRYHHEAPRRAPRSRWRRCGSTTCAP